MAIRGASFGLRQSLDTVGAFIGPLLAIVLMWLLANNITGVFWFAVVPAFLAMFLMIYGVADPDRQTKPREARFPLRVNELKRLGLLYWNVVAVAVVFTLARFSEAFLILRAQNVGLDMALVPAVLVLMNVFYALAAYPAGVLSDKGDRTKLLTIGLLLLVAADLILALTSGTHRGCYRGRVVGAAYGLLAGLAFRSRRRCRACGTPRYGLWDAQPLDRRCSSRRKRHRRYSVGCDRTASHLPRRSGVCRSCAQRASSIPWPSGDVSSVLTAVPNVR